MRLAVSGIKKYGKYETGEPFIVVEAFDDDSDEELEIELILWDDFDKNQWFIEQLKKATEA